MHISMKCVPKDPVNNVSSFVSDNGLEPCRRQAIIWTNVGLFHLRIYMWLGLDELKGRPEFIPDLSQSQISRSLTAFIQKQIIISVVTKL